MSMMKWSSNLFGVISLLHYIVITLLIVSCEQPVYDDDDGGFANLTFQTTTKDLTRSADLSTYFSKLNIQLFDAAGERVFSSVKTQTKSDSNFGHLTVKLAPGSYTVVAVGHSSTVSATIKSPAVCQFTSSNGEKLTDTFCACKKIDIGTGDQNFTFDMYRAVAMVQFCFTDSMPPQNFARVKMEYTGGSSNFNPTTLEGITKSSQSEMRSTNGVHIYQAFTFPYLADTGVLKFIVSALDADGNIIRQRTFDDVNVTRNRISTYRGPMFEDGDGEFTESDFSFYIHADWEGETFYEF